MMNFTEIAEKRQSCREYDEKKTVESKKLDGALRTIGRGDFKSNGKQKRERIALFFFFVIKWVWG